MGCSSIKDALTESKPTLVKIDRSESKTGYLEYEFIDCPETFAQLIEKYIGLDAADYFREIVVFCGEVEFDQSECDGECDHTYEMQEHYERVIRDAIEDFREAEVRQVGGKWTSGKVNVDAYEQAIARLENEI